MSADALYTFLYNLIDYLLNDVSELNLNIPIIQSHQNVPAPSEEDRYIVIDYAPNRDRIGRASSADTNESTNTRKHVNDYEYTTEIWEVNGNGDLLAVILDSIERQEIRNMWDDANFALRRQGDITFIPSDNNEEYWKKECMVELIIGTATETIENAGWIEDIEYEGTFVKPDNSEIIRSHP